MEGTIMKKSRLLGTACAFAFASIITQSAHATTILTGDPSCRPITGGSGCFISNLQPDGPFAFDSETFQINLSNMQHIEIFEGNHFQANLTKFSIFNSSSSSLAQLNIFLSFTDENQNTVGPTDGRGVDINPSSSVRFLQIIATSVPVPDFIFHGIMIDFICSNCLPDQLELSFLSDTDIIGVNSTDLNNRVGTWVPVPAAVWLFGSGLLGLVGMARRKKTV
jgi:hypothetical protein